MPRLMSEDDLDAVARIEMISMPQPWTRAQLTESLLKPHYRFFVETDSCGEVVGYMGCYICLPEADVTDIAVLPEHRRRGVAYRLMEYCERYLCEQGVDKITLEARVTNHAAIRLYERRNYVNCGVRPRFYADGENAVIYSKRLCAGDSDHRENKLLSDG